MSECYFTGLRTPSFRYPGGKARLRSWVSQFFPANGGTYVEPFAGVGNVFFLARKSLGFEKWWINDVNTHSFFQAILDVNPDDLPDTVDHLAFRRLAADRENPVSRVLEPRISFLGKGYDAGFSTTHSTHVGYAKKNYVNQIIPAKLLLKDVTITGISWEQLPFEEFANTDFVYLDPPYFGTTVSTYDNILHDDLLNVLTKAKFSWVLSGYENELYNNVLGPPAASRARAAEMSAVSGKKGQTRLECVWTSRSVP